MKYVVSAQEYFGSLNENQSNLDWLQAYFESIPQAFWEALEKIDLSPLSEFRPVKRTRTEEEISEHQLFLLENLDNVEDLLRKEDFLARLGYDTVALREQGEYFEKIETLNESILSSVWNFITALVEDPDPVEMALNIIRLILDVIGLIPFTWAGLPIDIVANILSALISLYKGEYLSMVLSLLAAVDVTQATDALKLALRGIPRPAMNALEKLVKILCRSGKDAFAVENGIIKLQSEIIEIGGKGAGGIFELIVKILKGVAGFISNTVVMVLRSATQFVDKIVSYVPIFGKHIAQTTKVLDGIIDSISMVGKNFDTAVKTLEKGGLATTADIAKTARDLKQTAKTSVAKQAYADAAASGKVGQAIQVDVQKAVADFDRSAADKYLTKSDYVKDVKKAVEDSQIFKEKISKLPKDMQDAYIAAKTENELIGQAKLSWDRVLADKELANYFTSIGYAPDGLQLLNLAKSGDKVAVRNFFEAFITNAKVSKALTKEEIRAFTPFVAKPEAFITGVKNMDQTIKQLKSLEKAAGISQKRAIPLKRILNFLTRLVWQRYGSLECIAQAGANNLGKSAVDATTKLAAGAVGASAGLVPAPTNEAGEAAPETMTNKSGEEILLKTLEDRKKLQEEIEKRKKDCGLPAAAVNATVGAHIKTDFPGSTANLGGSPTKGPDPEKAAEYTKRLLKSLGLDDSIDAQHALSESDPVVQLYAADVWDEEHGIVDLNLSDTSRLDDLAERMKKEGILTPEEIDRAVAKVKADLAAGEVPEFPVPKAEKKTNESTLLKVKSFVN